MPTTKKKPAAKKAKPVVKKKVVKPKAAPAAKPRKAPVKGRTAVRAGKTSPVKRKPRKGAKTATKTAPVKPRSKPKPQPVAVVEPAGDKPKPLDPAKVKLWYVLCVEPGADGKVCKGIRKKNLIEDMGGEIGRVFSPTSVTEKMLPKAGDVLAEGKEPEPDVARRAGIKWVWDHVGVDEWSRDPNMPPPGYRVVIFPAMSTTKGKQGNGWQWKVRDERTQEERKCFVRERLFPGYVLVRMKMNAETFHLVRSIRGVSYYLPSDASPTALETEEAATLLIQQTETNKKAKEAKKKIVKMDYKVGDSVDVLEGVWQGQTGKVQEIKGTPEDPVVTVVFTIWGKPVPVPMKHDQMVKAK